MNDNHIQDEYFDWLEDSMCEDRFASEISFRKLFVCLHSVEFTWTFELDENRAIDGIDLRRRFAYDLGYDEEYFTEALDGPCSVLEMMVAIAIRCEETIMDNTAYGDRTTTWFWNMVTSLGLGGMYDSRFDKDFVMTTIHNLLDHKYSRDGRGGLFTIPNCRKDLRRVEIWHQLNWYLDNFN